MISRAQLAILNPLVPAQEFLTIDLTSLGADGQRNQFRQTRFSANVVCLDIIGPDVPDLSFIDLPGR